MVIQVTKWIWVGRGTCCSYWLLFEGVVGWVGGAVIMKAEVRK